MKREFILSTYLLFSIFINSFGQAPLRITDDSFRDENPSVYKSVIVWESHRVFGEGESEIFMIKDGRTIRLTHDFVDDYDPIVDSVYVVWRKSKIGSQDRGNDLLICYDGMNYTQLSEGDILQYFTSGDKVCWQTRLYNIEKEQSKYYYHLYDGNKIQNNIASSEDSTYIIGLNNNGNNIYFFKIQDSVTTSLRYYNFKDTIEIYKAINSDFNIEPIESKAFYFNVYNRISKEYEYFAFVDNKLYNSTAIYNKMDFTCSGDGLEGRSWIDPYTYTFLDCTVSKDSPSYYVRRMGKLFKVGTYPFNSITSFPELSDIEDFFAVNVKLNNGGFIKKVFAYSNNIIYNVSDPRENFTNTRIRISGKYATWLTYDVSKFNYNVNEQEIFAVCYDACEKPWKFTEQLLNVHFNNSSKSINIKIITDNKNDYYFCLYDLAGRRIIDQKLNTLYGENLFQIPAYSLAHGIYLVQIINPHNIDQKFFKKIFITN